MPSKEPQSPSLEDQLNHLDFSGDSQSRQQLYHRLKQHAARPIYHQPLHVTVFSRLGAAALLALVLGVLVGTLRFQVTFPGLAMTAISAPHVIPAVTPGTAIVAAHDQYVTYPHPQPTPLAPTIPDQENTSVVRTGTRLP
jgi:hypothetical protein